METISVRKLDHSNLHVNCEYGVAAELKEFFSFYVPGYRFMPAFKRRVWDGKIRLYDVNTGELPAGLFPQLKVFVNTRGYNLKNIRTKYGLATDENNVKPEDIFYFSKTLKF